MPESPFPKLSPVDQCLHDMSHDVFTAYHRTEGKDAFNNEKLDQASTITWDAYVALRSLLGDIIK
jgi:hypothetical protein